MSGIPKFVDTQLPFWKALDLPGAHLPGAQINAWPAPFDACPTQTTHTAVCGPSVLEQCSNLKDALRDLLAWADKTAHGLDQSTFGGYGVTHGGPPLENARRLLQEIG